MLTCTLRLCIFLGLCFDLCGRRGLVNAEEDILVMDITAPLGKLENTPATPVKIGAYSAEALKKAELQLGELAKVASKEAGEKESTAYFLDKVKKPSSKPEALTTVEPVLLVESPDSPPDSPTETETTGGKPAPGTTPGKPTTTPATTPGTTSGKPATTPATIPATTPGTTPATGAKTGATTGPRTIRLTRRNVYSAKSPYFKKKKIYTSPTSNYEMLNVLGEGSFGVVWGAAKSPLPDPADKTKKKDKPPSESVAVKCTAAFVKKDNGDRLSTNEARKLKKEMEIWKYFNTRDLSCSQFIVNYYEYFRYLKVPEDPMKHSVNGLSMELAEYGSLEKFVTNNFEVARANAHLLMMHILKGLVCFHKEGYAHRDLKPGNILVRKMINGDPHAIISDLGLSTVHADNPNSWGTRLYAAPEYWNRIGGDVNPALADMFSVGCIFYYLLTGEHPKRPSETYVNGNGENKLKYGHVIFTQEEFKTVGLGLLESDFLQRLCWYDPAERMTLQQALQHPYINHPNNGGLTFSQFLQQFPLPKINPQGLVFHLYDPVDKPDCAEYIVMRKRLAALKNSNILF